ncbi:MAG: alcohol dehydrogenase catalytic domain-containing protein [Acidimicrobiia bacterium]
MSQQSPTTVLALGKLAPGQGNLGLRSQVVVEPRPGEALIRVIATGVCGTDLHIADDEFPYEAPVTMGHEVTGVVERVGAPPHEGWVGKRVALETYFSTCGICEHCRSGRPNLCDLRRSIGSREEGGFSPWIVVPVRNLWEIPGHVGRHAGALAEPLACVAQCLLDPPVVNPGDRVLITGPGTMGLLTAQVARASGGTVTVAGLERDRSRLELAASLGLGTLLLDDASQPLQEQFDVVCECSGAEPAAAYALEQVKKGGRYIQVGIFGRPVTVSLDQVLYKELTVTSGNASTPRSWGRAIALLEAGLVDLDPLITEVAPLGDWERVFDAVRSGDGLKYVISPGEGV